MPNYEFTREVEDVVALVEATGEPVLLPENTIPPGALEQIQALVDGNDLETAMEVFLREITQMTEQELGVYRQSPLWKPRTPPCQDGQQGGGDRPLNTIRSRSGRPGHSEER